jgi:hypothetical protein
MNDFEVMPIGTAVEIKAMREYSSRLIFEIDSTENIPENVRNLVNEIRNFYKWHVDRYHSITI